MNSIYRLQVEDSWDGENSCLRSQFLNSLWGFELSQDWLLGCFPVTQASPLCPLPRSSLGEAIPCLAEFSNEPSNNTTKLRKYKP